MRLTKRIGLQFFAEEGNSGVVTSQAEMQPVAQQTTTEHGHSTQRGECGVQPTKVGNQSVLVAQPEVSVPEDANSQQAETEQRPIVYQSERKARRERRQRLRERSESVISEADTSAPDVTTEDPQPDKPDKRKAFRDMIHGEYKEEFTALFNERWNQRHKEHAQASETLGKYEGIIDRLRARYGQQDIDALTAAFDADEAFWDMAADAEGMTRAQYQAMITKTIELEQAKRENARLAQITDERHFEEHRDADIDAKLQEAEALRAKYPDFDLSHELDDPRFVRLLRAGVSVEHAYTTLHMDDIMGGAIQSATSTPTTSPRKRESPRPHENGMSATSGLKVYRNASTREERARIAEEVKRGKRVSFH